MAKGKKTGGGSRKGVPNKASGEIKEAAQVYGPAAVERLAKLAGLVEGVEPAASESVQVSACHELLDRGYGKPSQPIEHTGEGLEALLDQLGGKIRGA